VIGTTLAPEARYEQSESIALPFVRSGWPVLAGLGEVEGEGEREDGDPE
jgi:hypothetical protein